MAVRLLIASNREPLRREGEGWQPSVGGLTTALLPLLERRGGVWVAWGEEDAEKRPTVRYPEEEPVLEVARLALSEREIEGYYYGFSNRTLWPLCHYFNERTDLQREMWETYAQVNRRFAVRLHELHREGDLVWIQDYHLMLAPGMLRERLPDARVGFFFHIPWPAPEVWQVLPWGRLLVEGILGADVVGFHTPGYCRNFLETVAELDGAEVEGDRVRWRGRDVRVEPHPIGIDVQRFRELAAREDVRAEAERIRGELNAELLFLGVDRLDYTKGVPERLLAFEEFLEQNEEAHGRACLLQVGAPSRTRIDSYQELKRRVDEITGRIDGAYMDGSWTPVHYHYRSHPQEELVALYLAADALLVTPLRDGMNLVAQEFAGITERGSLVLSRLAGAAEVLSAPYLVNPYDVHGMAEVMKQILHTRPEDRREGMRGLRHEVEELDIHGWGARFLASLEAV